MINKNNLKNKEGRKEGRKVCQTHVKLVKIKNIRQNDE